MPIPQRRHIRNDFPETKLRLLQLDDDDNANDEHTLPRSQLLLSGSSSKDEDVIQYIRQLQFAIHMGLNCLAIDIGSDPMLISTPISSSSILTSSTTRKLTTMTQDQVTKTPKLSNAAATATTTTRKRGVPTLAYLSIMDCYLLEDDSQVVKTDGSNDKMVSKIYYFM